jgi:ribosomal protein S18 acetylase RimI-like enzyme
MAGPHQGVTVRHARLRDAPALGAFLQRAWRQGGPGALGFTGANDDAVREISSPEFLTSRIASPRARMVLAHESGEVVGLASLRMDGKGRAELSGIVVLQGATGKGVGTRLLRKAEAYAWGAGVRELVVKTETFNARAVGFYEKNGFSRARRATEMVGRTKVPLVVLEKRLRSPQPSKG